MNSELKTKLAAVIAGLISSALPVMAHPGHSLSDGRFSHLLTSPDHLVVLALAGGAMSAAGYFVSHRLPRRLLQWGGAVVVCAAASGSFLP